MIAWEIKSISAGRQSDMTWGEAEGRGPGWDSFSREEQRLPCCFVHIVQTRDGKI